MDFVTTFLNSLVSGTSYFLYATYHSFFFAVVKFLIGIYVIVVFLDIILLLYQRGLSGDFRATVLGMNVPPELITKQGKKALQKKWNDVKKKLDSSDAADYKLAILQAEDIIDNLLERMGYGGSNFGERLAGIPAGQVEVIGQLKEAHEVRNRIVVDQSFNLTKESAEKTFRLYEEFLSYHQVF